MSSQVVIKLMICYVMFRDAGSILYPQDSESREVKDLSGRWSFRIDEHNEGFEHAWWENNLKDTGNVIDMPVPASYNDVTSNRTIRDFVGWAWYDRTFFVPNKWSEDVLVWLRVGSAHYNSVVWVNGVQVMSHVGGHLPFECEISNHLKYVGENRLTIAVNNTLTPNTLPPGTIEHYVGQQGYPAGYFTQEYEFDFFNYAGIHRPVKLYTTPTIKINEIATFSDIDGTTGYIHYSINVTSKKSHDFNTSVTIRNKDGDVVTSAIGVTGVLTVTHARLWWPVGMNSDVAYMYTMEVCATEIASDDRKSINEDIYRLKIGIRTAEVEGTEFRINKKKFYFAGVGKHEDWNVRGKGFDWTMVINDFNILNWLNANSFRTSHYPYAEEIMQLCDERGIVVIDECPAVGMRAANNFVNVTLEHHLAVMAELVARDRNHPSVVMWSVANEPASQLTEAGPYFKSVIEETKKLDLHRPVTFVCNAQYNHDIATPYVDVVSFNKYEGWYNDPGHIEVIQGRLNNYVNMWHQTRPDKPIIHMEWGGGAISGFHSNPSLMYTEDYLVDLMQEHFKVFDSLRQENGSYFAGEMIWNFADFATAQATTRAYGNRKGLFTRERHPKWPAYIIRERYSSLNNIISSVDRENNNDYMLKLHFQIRYSDGTN